MAASDFRFLGVLCTSRFSEVDAISLVCPISLGILERGQLAGPADKHYTMNVRDDLTCTRQRATRPIANSKRTKI